MAGKGQHFLPRFLLKGFPSRREGNEIFTWVFRQGAQPFETNIKNVGKERDFYGSEGIGSLDDELTHHESRLAAVLDAVRSEGRVTPDAVTSLTSLVLHLAIRPRHLREGFSEAAGRVLDAVRRRVSEPATAAELALQGIRDNPDILRTRCRELLAKQYGRQPTRDELARAVARFRPLVAQATQAQSAVLAGVVEQLLQDAQNQRHTMTKNAHNEALSRVTGAGGRRKKALKKRERRLRALDWSVVEFDGGLILGDVGPIARVRSGEFTIALTNFDEVQAIVLPISVHQLLLASNGEADLAAEEINKANAQLSREFFVSSECSGHQRTLHERLGERAQLLSDEELSAQEGSLLRKD